MFWTVIDAVLCMQEKRKKARNLKNVKKQNNCLEYTKKIKIQKKKKRKERKRKILKERK